MSQASRALDWATVLTLAVAPSACSLWPEYGGNDCGDETVEIAPGEAEEGLDPWELVAPYEGTWEVNWSWDLVGRHTTAGITLARRDETAIAHRDCAGWDRWDSVDVPVALWIRTEDGAFDVVYEGPLPLTDAGLLREDLHQFDVPVEAVPLEHVVPRDQLPVNDPVTSVRLDLRFDTSRPAFDLTSGNLMIEYQYSYRREYIASLAPAD
jgi:hypothetical protein